MSKLLAQILSAAHFLPKCASISERPQSLAFRGRTSKLREDEEARGAQCWSVVGGIGRSSYGASASVEGPEGRRSPGPKI